MSTVSPAVSALSHNEAAFEMCLAGALQIVASLEFGGLLGEDRPTRELLVAFAEKIERLAEDLAVLAGEARSEVGMQGRAWFEALLGVRDEPLQVAHYALHAAAHLGLGDGMKTARVLSAVGQTLRVVAERDGRLTN